MQVVLSNASASENSASQMPQGIPAHEDPLFWAQIQGMKEMTAIINRSCEIESINSVE